MQLKNPKLWSLVVSTGLVGGAFAEEAAPAPEPRLEKVLKGFYGTLDVSFDVTDKGIDGLVAFPYQLNDPANPGSGFSIAGPAKSGPVGRMAWMPALSTNKSNLGYRGDHPIGDSASGLVYQIEAGVAITAAPGLNTTYVQQSNVVRSAIGFGDTFIGLRGAPWGAIKAGTTYSPYKKSTDRLNPFSGMLGDYTAVMANSGGDNRVEFATRLDHSIWYESPRIAGLVGFDFLWSPGQNRTYDNVIQSAGSADCSGGNIPGSGNLPLNCDDGGFGDALAADLHIEAGGFYAAGAFEWHHQVNRNSDGIGSNNPLYGYLASTSPGEVISSSNNPQGLPGSALGAYVRDIGNEWAGKVALQYSFPFGLSVGGIYEILRRSVPAFLDFQNERSREGWWLTATMKSGPGSLSAGWAHATKTPGDPGGMHNYNPTAEANTADMFTVGYKHQLDKQVYAYIDAADTINHGNAHYDLGAGGRGLVTDCHDGTNTVFTDNSGGGPTTWGGCHVIGVSAGLNYKF